MTQLARTNKGGMRLLIALAGPLIWAAHAVLLYGGHTVLCAQSSAPARSLGWIALVALATMFGLALLAALFVREWRGARRTRSAKRDAHAFLRDLTFALTILSALGVLWMATPAALIPPCTGP